MMFFRVKITPFIFLSFFYSDISYAYKNDIGYVKLSVELGVNVPDGNGVLVTQDEADTDGVVDAFYKVMPDTANAQFAGKTISNVSGLNFTVSNHATSVGVFFYGSNAMANGINAINSYEANDWIQAGYLRLGFSTKPLAVSDRIGNHSWVGSYGNLTFDSEILRRLDWVIETDEFIQAVGTRNNTGLNSNLLSSAYNTIAVGKTNGVHSTGSAQIDPTYVSGRSKTEIVAPLTVTSTATPVVASTAALLVGVANSDSSLSNGSTSNRSGNTIYNAERSETIKAALLSGADRLTKNTSTAANISDYRAVPSNQTINGLDARFGAGQVNVYNSYKIITAGEQDSDEDDGAATGNIGVFGFDYDPSFGGLSGSNNTASYYFSTGSNSEILSASLAWNIDIAGGNRNFDGTAVLYDLDLLLYDVTGSQILLISSTSNIDNTENIWTALQAGKNYLLKVIPKAGQSDFLWDYSLAWKISKDIDGDVVSDELDNCLNVSNPDQADLDADGIGDVCDVDIDGDGVINSADAFPRDPLESIDTDNDGIGNNADLDDDNDGLLDTVEDANSNGVVDIGETDSLNFDTDGDSYSDGAEVAAGTDPLNSSSFPVVSDGDLNGDNVVNIVDLMIMQNILSGNLTPTAEQLIHGDVAPLVTGVPAPDGQIDIGDLVVISRKVMGEIDF